MNMDLTIEKKIDIKAPAEEVWDAITDPDKVEKYFFGSRVETDWKPGSPIFFSGEWEGETYKDRGRILNVDKPEKIQYSYWSAFSGLPDKPENYSIVEYNLEEKDGNTAVTIRQKGFAKPENEEHAINGWQQVLDGLKELVEK